MDDKTPEIAKQPRDWGFLVAAVFVLGVGITYFVVGAILSGVVFLQGIVVVSILMISGGFLAMWWYSGSVESDPDKLESPSPAAPRPHRRRRP